MQSVGAYTPLDGTNLTPINLLGLVNGTNNDTITTIQLAVGTFTKDDARKTAEAVRKAVKGLGTDDAGLIKALCHLTNEQRVMASNEYYGMFGRSLKQDVKNDLSGNYRRLVLGMCMPRIQFMASEIHRAVKGAGTDDHCLIELLSHTDTVTRIAVQTFFEVRYKRSLRSYLSSDTSFNFKKALLASLEECKLVCNPTEDAIALYKAGEGKLGTNEDVFIDILCHRSPKQIQAICAEYEKQKSGHTLIKAIKSECSGDFQDFLVAICTPWAEYWAVRISHAVKGMGTNDAKLIRSFLMNDRYTIPLIAAEYKKLYSKSLKKDVEGDTSANYKKSFIALMEGLQCE